MRREEMKRNQHAGTKHHGYRQSQRHLLIAFSILIVLLFVPATFAQSPTGDVQGTVADASGAVISNAKVTITETATGRIIETITNDAGLYSALHLLPGEYTVKIEKTGFASFSEKIEVRAGQVAAVNPRLKVGEATTTVEVLGQGAVVADVTRSTVDGVIEARQIENLPENQRNFLDLAALEPGVFVRDGGNIDPTKSATYRTVGVDGRSGTGTRVQVDGIDVTDETVGTTLANISNDAVSEFQLSQSSLDLSTSLTSSGAINIITRSGGNQIHGSGFEFFRDKNMSARVGDQLTAEPFRRHQYGFRAGGPFQKNKLFWFVNGEHLTQLALDPSTVAISQAFGPFANFFGTNCQNGCGAGTPLDVKLGNARLDWNVTGNLRAFYRYNYSSDLAAGGTVPFSPFQNVDWTIVHTLGLDYSSGRFSHSYRYGYVNFNNRIISQQFAGFPFPVAPTGQAYNLSVVDTVGRGLTAGPNGLAPQETDQNNYQNKYDGSFVFGKHALRYGVEFNHIVLGGFANFAGPLSIAGTLPAGSIDPNPLNYALSDFTTGPNNGFFTVDGCQGFNHGCHRNNRIAWYVGNSWKKFSNFTLNYGTRWEFDTGYFNSEGSNGVHRPSYLDYFLPGASKTPSFPLTAFSPQLGFAWDPWKNGKTSIRAGAYLAYEMNIFNNLLFDQSALIPSGIGPDTFGSTFVGGPDGNPITPAQAGISIASLPATCQGSAAIAAMNGGDYSCLVGNPIGSTLGAIGALDKKLKNLYQNFNFNPASGSAQFLTLKGNTLGFLIGGDKFKLPYSTQFNIGFERELTKNNVLSVDFLFNHGVHQGFLGQDFECRRCANTLNVAAAQAKAASVLGGQTVDQWIANPANAGKTITAFGLASDSIFRGRTPDPAASDPIIQTTNFLRARMVGDGGFTKYRALNVKLRGRLNQSFFHSLKNSVYQLSYAWSNSEATNGANRTEFLNTALDKRDPTTSAYFGNTGLDHRHNFAASLTTQVPFGFHIGQIWSFRTAPPLTLFMPAIGITGQNTLFTTDILGEGGSASAPLAQVIPGTKVGEFGRGINSWSDLNAAITAYNNSFAGKLTPAGQALVNAGIFTQAQLVQLKAVTPTIPLVPTSNPWPFENFFNLDMTLSRPIKLAKLHEGVELEPLVQAFNLFNNNSRGNYTGALDGGFGALNYDYNSATNNASSNCAVGSVQSCLKALELTRARTNINRQFQVGIRLNF
jgi:Carboxypeptidase regulatory-like domain